MIGNRGQKDREEKLSQFIDELNQEKKPSVSSTGNEEDQELYELLDTVRAVKSLRIEDIPEVPKFKAHNRGYGRNIWRYGVAAACIIIVVMVASGNRNILTLGMSLKNGSPNKCAVTNEDGQDLASYDNNKIYNSNEKNKGSNENIATVYTSCSAAATLLEGLPKGLEITKVAKLEESSYTYCVGCSWDKESFMDIYILPGVEGYGMNYTNTCYSFMDGIIEENTDTGLNKSYREAVNTLSWSGNGFTIMMVSDRKCQEIRSTLEKITGYESIPLGQQEQDKLKKNK